MLLIIIFFFIGIIIGLGISLLFKKGKIQDLTIRVGYWEVQADVWRSRYIGNKDKSWEIRKNYEKTIAKMGRIIANKRSKREKEKNENIQNHP